MDLILESIWGIKCSGKKAGANSGGGRHSEKAKG